MCRNREIVIDPLFKAVTVIFSLFLFGESIVY